MDKELVEGALFSLLEPLAAIEHERWARWQRYMHDSGQLQADGSLLIPAALVQHWERQIATPYAALSESEKESDREQVHHVIKLIVNRFAAPWSYS